MCCLCHTSNIHAHLPAVYLLHSRIRMNIKWPSLNYYNSPNLHFFMFVCYLIKSVPCRESAPDAPYQLREAGARLLAGCHSPSCLAAEKRNVLCPYSAGRHTIFTIIDQPFHYQSLEDLMRAVPLKGVRDASLERCRSPSCPAAEERTSFFRRTEMPF